MPFISLFLALLLAGPSPAATRDSGPDPAALRRAAGLIHDGRLSKVVEYDFTGGKGYMKIGAEFDWPHVPHHQGGTVDMRTFVDLPVSGAFSTHVLDPSRPQAFFLAWSPRSKVLIGYTWKQTDFPWLGIWEENRSRTAPPWNGQTITRAMEFGVSPFPKNRREMIDRGRLFGVPGYRWIPARTTVRVEYQAFVTTCDAIPETPPV